MKNRIFSKILGISIVMMILMTGFVFAGGQQDAKAGDKEIVIGVTMESLEDFLSYVADGLNAYAEETPGVKVVVMDAKKDMARQLGQVENFIAQGVDAIVIKAVDKDATDPISKKCTEAGIPLVATNININSFVNTYVGSDHKYSGVIETEYICELVGGKGNVAILQGDPSHDAAQERTEGTEEVIAKYPNMKIVAQQSGYWARDKGMQIAENWIQSGQKIDIIIGNNDEMSLGAVLAYEQAGIKDIIIGGIDATEDALTFLKDGRLDVTVFQDGYGQGYGAAKAAHELVMGKNVPSYVDVPYVLVPPEKAAEYLAKFKK